MKFPEIISTIVSVLSFGFFVLTKGASFSFEARKLSMKILCWIVMLRSTIAIIGYCIGDERFTKWFGQTPMPFSSAVALLLLGFVIVWLINGVKDPKI